MILAHGRTHPIVQEARSRVLQDVAAGGKGVILRGGDVDEAPQELDAVSEADLGGWVDKVRELVFYARVAARTKGYALGVRGWGVVDNHGSVWVLWWRGKEKPTTTNTRW